MKAHTILTILVTVVLYTGLGAANVDAIVLSCSNEDVVETREFIDARQFTLHAMRGRTLALMANGRLDSIEQRYIAINIWHALAMFMPREYVYELFIINEKCTLSWQVLSVENFSLWNMAYYSGVYGYKQYLEVMQKLTTASYSTSQLYGNVKSKTYFAISYVNPYQNTWAANYPERWKIIKPFEEDQCQIDLFGVGYKPSPEHFNLLVFEHLLLCRMAKDLETAVTVLALLEKRKDSPEKTTSVAAAAQAVKDFACLLRKRLDTASYPLAVRENDPRFSGDPFAVFQGYQRQAEAAVLTADKALAVLPIGN